MNEGEAPRFATHGQTLTTSASGNEEVPNSVHLATLPWNQFVFILGWSSWQQKWPRMKAFEKSCLT